jgi:hypothetical protein
MRTIRILALSLRIAATNLITRFLEPLFLRRKGSAGRLRRVLSNSASVRGCTSRVLAAPVPLGRCEARFFTPGPQEREYLARLAVEGNASSEPAAIISADDVDISIPIGMHCWKGRVVQEALLSPKALLNPKYVFDLETIPFRPRSVIQEAVLLSLPWHHNFCHWMIDILPRLLLVDQADDLRAVPILVPEAAPSFVRQSLALTGYLDRVLFLKRGVYRVRRAHFLSRLTDVPDVSPLGIEWLNRKVPRSNVRGGKRLYVSRADAKMRFVANDKEVEKVMHEFGFETLVPSVHSLEEQIRRFREAKVVVGAHGAAFALLAFVDPGSTFIEMVDSAFFNRCFYRMAGVKRLQYGFVLGQTEGFGFVVDPGRLREFLKTALA